MELGVIPGASPPKTKQNQKTQKTKISLTVCQIVCVKEGGRDMRGEKNHRICPKESYMIIEGDR